MQGGEDKQRIFNEVLDTKPQPQPECGPSQLQSMGDRMLDWFSVVMADAATRRRPRQRSATKGWISITNFSAVNSRSFG